MSQFSETWTAESIDTLSRLWSEGLSASEIGAHLGTTRNAVIGKVNRLREKDSAAFASRKIPKSRHGRKPGRRPGMRKRRPELTFARRTPQPPKPLPPEQPCPEARMLSLMDDLTDKTCKYPIGDPKSPDFGFCGAETWRGPSSGSYCAHHYRIVYQPPEPRRR